eukprot:UN04701
MRATIVAIDEFPVLTTSITLVSIWQTAMTVSNSRIFEVCNDSALPTFFECSIKMFCCNSFCL